MLRLNNQWTLGQLIAALRHCRQDDEVIFDFCYYRPSGELRSYRGYYDHVALGYTDGYGAEKMTVRDLVQLLSAKLGTVMHGYKGGEYPIERDTAVWVSNYSESRGTFVRGLEANGGRVVILTDFERW